MSHDDSSMQGASLATTEFPVLGRADLFTGKPMPSRVVELMDGRRFKVQGISHGEKDEIEQGHLDWDEDGKLIRKNEGKASEYVARGLREANGAKMSVMTLPNGERHDAWKALAEELRNKMSPADVDILYLAVLDLSGLTKEHQDKVAKLSGLTPTA